jgi:hypothetical protein
MSSELEKYESVFVSLWLCVGGNSISRSLSGHCLVRWQTGDMNEEGECWGQRVLPIQTYNLKSLSWPQPWPPAVTAALMCLHLPMCCYLHSFPGQKCPVRWTLSCVWSSDLLLFSSPKLRDISSPSHSAWHPPLRISLTHSQWLY